MRNVIVIALVILIQACGTSLPQTNPYPLHDVPAGATGLLKICQHWSDAQPSGTTRYAGAAYCLSGTVYGIFDRYADGYVGMAPGTYQPAQTGLPCTFTVGASCAVTEE